MEVESMEEVEEAEDAPAAAAAPPPGLSTHQLQRQSSLTCSSLFQDQHQTKTGVV